MVGFGARPRAPGGGVQGYHGDLRHRAAPMHADLERWNRKYARRTAPPDAEPDPVLAACRASLPGRGLALDVACGTGRNALWLAGLGYRVVAVDGSLIGLQHARALLRGRAVEVSLVCADLELFPLPQSRFDLVVVIKYLDRGLLPRLADSVRPGGLLFYRSFNRRFLDSHPGMNPAYVLAPGELQAHFAGWRVLSADEGGELTHLLARRPAG